MKKTISFDLWDTLIKKDPEFSLKRIQLLKQYTDHTEEYIKDTFYVVKKDFDGIVEKYGLQFDNTVVYGAIFDRLNIRNLDIDLKYELINSINELFLKYHPTIYSDDTISVLEELHKTHELILISNTLLINGDILYEVIKKLNLAKYFSKIIFSCDVQCSKPHVNIFKIAYGHLNVNDKKDIIHVGDNIRTDLYGSTTYGAEGYIINNSKTSIHFKNKTITDFLNHVKAKNEK